MKKSQLEHFGQIDQTADPTYFIHFLDAVCAEASVQAYKKRLLEMLDIQPGGQLSRRRLRHRRRRPSHGRTGRPGPGGRRG